MLDFYNQFKDFKSFEISFLDAQGLKRTLYCSIKSIENNSIVLLANKTKNKNISPKVGDELKLHIYTDNGIYSAVSKLLFIFGGILNDEYVIAYPENSKHSQRREYFRAELALDFRIALLTNPRQSEDFIIDGKTKNICGKGMSYTSDTSFPDGEAIGLTLYFKEKTIDTFVELVYSKQFLISNATRYVHAFCFTTISQKNIDFIIKKCFLYQLDLRKKMM